nr:barstar family protein [Pedococcus badiiscoriae]
MGPEVTFDDVVRGARDRGHDVCVVPAGATKAESIELFAQVLDFPDWFGRNLDALADCLHDFAEQPLGGARARHLVWDGAAQLRRGHLETFEDIAGVLDEVSQDHASFVVTILDR